MALRSGRYHNLKHHKDAADQKRAAAWAKMGVLISSAVQLGGGVRPEDNPRLRLAITRARAVQMSSEAIERAIKKGAGGGEEGNYEEVRYEGFGPGGVAIIVEALTDNRNRTASEVRAAFSRHGGALGETNSVSFQFDRVGVVQYAPEVASADAMLEAAIEAGASDCQSSEAGHEIICDPEELAAVRDALEARFGPPSEARLGWRPQATVPVDDERAPELLKLIEQLDDNEDVQRVVANFEVSDAVLARLGG